MKKIIIAGVIDVFFLVLFAIAGRRSHELELDVAGIFETAWPFLVGAFVGWAIMRAWKNPFALRNAVPIWISTVIVGFLLRWLTGQGIAVPFMLVATGTTLILLVGWRLVFLLVRTFLNKNKDFHE